MSRRSMLWGRLVIATATTVLAAAGCDGSTGLSPLTYPLTARGAGGDPFTVGGWTVTIDEARIGFGPLYLCASLAASADLCPTAVAEFASTAVVDGKSGAWQPLGDITGFDGTVRSALYDFAFSWPDERGAHALAGAPDGHSAVMRATALKDGRTLRVRADLDVAPQQARAHAVQARLGETPQTANLRLEVTFPAAAWWGRVDFDALAASPVDDITLPALNDDGTVDPNADPATRAAFRARSTLLAAMTSTDRPTLAFTALSP